MPKVTLTDRFVANIKADSQTDYFDSKTTGLVLRVALNGVRTWCAFYTAPGGKRARLTLGRYPQTKLADARGLALAAMGQVDQGIDPRHVARGGMTVAALVASYLTKHVTGLRTAKGIGHRIANISTTIGDVELGKLHRRDVNRLVDPIMARGKHQEARAVFKQLRAMLAWAVERGDLDASPMQGMKAPAETSIRDRVLTEDEIRAALTAPLDPTLAALVRLCLLTAARIGEVAGMTASEIDPKTRVWNLPASRSKNGHAHVIPLSDAAFEIIEPLLTRGTLFPDAGTSARIGKALTRAKLSDWTMHDLRRTAVSGMAALGVSPIVLGHVINHRSVTKAGTTLKVYQTYTYDREKREALELWADRLAGIVGGGASQVIPMHSRNLAE